MVSRSSSSSGSTSDVEDSNSEGCSFEALGADPRPLAAICSFLDLVEIARMQRICKAFWHPFSASGDLFGLARVASIWIRGIRRVDLRFSNFSLITDQTVLSYFLRIVTGGQRLPQRWELYLGSSVLLNAQQILYFVQHQVRAAFEKAPNVIVLDDDWYPQPVEIDALTHEALNGETQRLFHQVLKGCPRIELRGSLLAEWSVMLEGQVNEAPLFIDELVIAPLYRNLSKPGATSLWNGSMMRRGSAFVQSAAPRRLHISVDDEATLSAVATILPLPGGLGAKPLLGLSELDSSKVGVPHPGDLDRRVAKALHDFTNAGRSELLPETLEYGAISALPIDRRGSATLRSLKVNFKDQLTTAADCFYRLEDLTLTSAHPLYNPEGVLVLAMLARSLDRCKFTAPALALDVDSPLCRELCATVDVFSSLTLIFPPPLKPSLPISVDDTNSTAARALERRRGCLPLPPTSLTGLSRMSLLNFHGEHLEILSFITPSPLRLLSISSRESLPSRVLCWVLKLLRPKNLDLKPSPIDFLLYRYLVPAKSIFMAQGGLTFSSVNIPVMLKRLSEGPGALSSRVRFHICQIHSRICPPGCNTMPISYLIRGPLSAMRDLVKADDDWHYARTNLLRGVLRESRSPILRTLRQYLDVNVNIAETFGPAFMAAIEEEQHMWGDKHSGPPPVLGTIPTVAVHRDLRNSAAARRLAATSCGPGRNAALGEVLTVGQVAEAVRLAFALQLQLSQLFQILLLLPEALESEMEWIRELTRHLVESLLEMQGKSKFLLDVGGWGSRRKGVSYLAITLVATDTKDERDEIRHEVEALIARIKSQ